jgi:hypothetical protein
VEGDAVGVESLSMVQVVELCISRRLSLVKLMELTDFPQVLLSRFEGDLREVDRFEIPEVVAVLVVVLEVKVTQLRLDGVGGEETGCGRGDQQSTYRIVNIFTNLHTKSVAV